MLARPLTASLAPRTLGAAPETGGIQNRLAKGMQLESEEGSDLACHSYYVVTLRGLEFH